MPLLAPAGVGKSANPRGFFASESPVGTELYRTRVNISDLQVYPLFWLDS